MNLPFFIARRYFVSRKSRHVIHIISWVAMAGIATGTAGLVIVLSVFNGFSDLITDLYDASDPDIRITAREGKVFDPALVDTALLMNINGVAWVSLTLEENALVRYRDRQSIAVIKGVDDRFARTSRVPQRMADGEYVLEDGEQRFALVGSSMAYTLGMNLDDIFSTLSVYVPNRETGSVALTGQAFTNLVIRPAGVFAIQQDFDSRYILVPLSFARKLTGEAARVSAMEIALKPDAGAEVKSEIRALAGPSFRVLDRIEQHDFLNKIFSSEKWAIYIILGFILLIASFSIIGSVTMLVIEKKQDIATFLAMGIRLPAVRRVFLVQGTLIAAAGGLAGIALGGGIAFLQQRFKLVRLSQSDAFLIDAYPVALQAMDLVNSFLLVFLIGLALSWFTTGKIIQKERLVPSKR